MKIEKGKYLLIVSYGSGRQFIRGPLTQRLLNTCAYAALEAINLNKRKSPRAPEARVSVVRVIEVYGKGGASGKLSSS